MTRGELWWADLGVPFGSEPGFRRPVIVVQADSFNRSRISTVIVVPLTTNIDLEDAPGNVLLETQESGLAKDSVVVVSQISTFDRRRLIEKVRALSIGSMKSIEKGIKIVLEME